MQTTTNTPTTPAATNGSRRITSDPVLWTVVGTAAMIGLLAIALPEFRELVTTMWGTFGPVVWMVMGLLAVTVITAWLAGRYMRPLSRKARDRVGNVAFAATLMVVTATIVYMVIYGGYAPLTLPGIFTSLGLMMVLVVSFVLPVRESDEA
jgi:hypothetical protein